MARSKSEPRQCGALTRTGGACRASAMRKSWNGRCRLHGGKLPIENTTAPYIGAVLPAEASLFAALPVGTVDEELKLCRLRLSRAAAAEAKLIASGESEGLARIQDEINRITTRIDRFENRRVQLLTLAAAAVAAGTPPDDALADPHALARAIRSALDDIEASTASEGDGSDFDSDVDA